jgi:hypothetical protein
MKVMRQSYFDIGLISHVDIARTGLQPFRLSSGLFEFRVDI